MKRTPYKGRDHFGERARQEGYEARSVYKLEEIQRRYSLLRGGMRVVDLGCFPGSWSRYAIEVVGGNGRVVGVDLEEPAVSGGHWIGRSVFEVTVEELREALGGAADVVLSDMAPRTTGNKLGDHVAQIELARCALDIATELLVPGGSFVTKVFEGEDANALVTDIKARFDTLKRVRPEAVRKVSREFFVVATGRR